MHVNLVCESVRVHGAIQSEGEGGKGEGDVQKKRGKKEKEKDTNDEIFAQFTPLLCFHSSKERDLALEGLAHQNCIKSQKMPKR